MRIANELRSTQSTFDKITTRYVRTVNIFLLFLMPYSYELCLFPLLRSFESFSIRHFFSLSSFVYISRAIGSAIEDVYYNKNDGDYFNPLKFFSSSILC